MDRGYLKLWRKSLDSEVFANDSLWRLWTWCLMKATHKNRHSSISTGRGQVVVSTHPGQFIFGRNKAAEVFEWSPSTIWKRMQKLEALGCIHIESNNHCSVISICNWEEYQAESDSQGTAKEQPSDSQVTAKEQPSDTDKNVKNDKKKDISATVVAVVSSQKEKEKNQKRNERTVDLSKLGIESVAFDKLPPTVSKDVVEQFLIHRKAKKAPITQRALELTCASVVECASMYGMSPDDVLQYGIERGWQTVKPQWLEKDFPAKIDGNAKRDDGWNM